MNSLTFWKICYSNTFLLRAGWETSHICTGNKYEAMGQQAVSVA